MEPLVVVGSTNPVKIASAQALNEYSPFRFVSKSVPSGVPDQPVGDAQTLMGALHRARAALDAVPEATFGLGLEGGCKFEADLALTFAQCAIIHRDGRYGYAKSAEFPVPERVRQLMLNEGLELGTAMDRAYGHENSKQKMGASGILTDGLIDRSELYRHAVLFAYLPFLRPTEYKRLHFP